MEMNKKIIPSSEMLSLKEEAIDTATRLRRFVAFGDTSAGVID